MCESPNYFLRLKDEYDIKYHLTGVRTKLYYLAPVKSVAHGDYKLSYNKDKYDLIIRDCGQCRTCRYKKSRIKAVQVQSEAKAHKDNCFITLTFDSKKIYDYYLNEDIKKSYLARQKNAQRKTKILTWTLEKKLFQKFMKKLRFRLEQEYLREYSINHGYFNNYIKKNGELRERYIKSDEYDYSDYYPPLIKFYHAGEYGSLNQRPHHHAIIMGWNSNKDDYYYEEQYSYKRKRKEKVKRSKLLDECWKFGKNQVGTATYQSMNYVARYCTKKIKGKISEVHYNGRMPEYETASNREGLGLKDFRENVYQYLSNRSIPYKDVNGNISQSPLPNYFKVVLKRYYPQLYYQYCADCYNYSKKYNELTSDQILSRSRKQEKVTNEVHVSVGDSEFRPDFELSNPQNMLIMENINKRNIFGECNDLKFKSYRDIDECTNNLTWRQKKYNDFEASRKRKITLLKNAIISCKYKSSSKDENLLKSHIRNLNDLIEMKNPYLSKNFNFNAIQAIKELFCV